MSDSMNDEIPYSSAPSTEEFLEETLFPQEAEGDESRDPNYYPPPSADETQGLQEILDKEYAHGDVGKLEALQDLQTVFDELEKQKVVASVDILTPYNASKAKPQENLTKPGPKTHRFKSTRVELTPRPSVGLFGRDQSEVKNSSLPNLIKPTGSRTKQLDLMKGARASLPALGTGTPKKEARIRKNKSQIPSRIHEDILRSRKNPPKICVSDAIDIVQRDLDLATTTEFPRPQTSASMDSQNTTEPETDVDEGWKADVNKVTRARTSSKPFSRSSEEGVLQLKYKPPVWPHQQCLNQILARAPQITCLILDGSEIQFLRDLGSSLLALETLSISKCGLRSVDGTFGFPNLRTFIASGNKIQHPSQCSYLPYLNYLDLSGNPIEDMDGFLHLRCCKDLASLKVHNTPVSKIPDFERKMRRILPQVKEIFPICTYVKGTKPKGNVKKVEEPGRDPLQMMMRKDLNLVYKKIVDNPKPFGIGFQDFRTSEVPMVSVPSTAGTGTTTDDTSFGPPWTHGFQQSSTPITAPFTSDSYITEIEETKKTASFTRTSTSGSPGQGGLSTDFSYGDGRNVSSTGSSILPREESMEELFLQRKQTATTTEVEDTDTDGYGYGDVDID